MATITGLTAAAMAAIRDGAIVSVEVVGDDLMLTLFDGSIVNAGNVRGPQGDQGVPGTIPAALQNVVRGQVTATAPGGGRYADAVVTDNLGSTNKRAIGNLHGGGTYTTWGGYIVVASTTTNTTTLRFFTEDPGNITVGQTVLIDYWIWKD